MQVKVAKLLRHDGAAARVDVLIRVRAGRIAGEADLIARGMAGIIVVEAAEDRPLIHDLAAHRQQVREKDAGDVGGKRAKLAAILGRGVGLRIPHIDVAGAAAHPEDNDRRLTRGTGRGGRFVPEQIGETEPGGAEHACFQKGAAVVP